MRPGFLWGIVVIHIHISSHSAAQAAFRSGGFQPPLCSSCCSCCYFNITAGTFQRKSRSIRKEKAQPGIFAEWQESCYNENRSCGFSGENTCRSGRRNNLHVRHKVLRPARRTDNAGESKRQHPVLGSCRYPASGIRREAGRNQVSAAGHPHLPEEEI